MVREANLKQSFDLPKNIQKNRLIGWIQNQSFSDTNKDMYSNMERDAA